MRRAMGITMISLLALAGSAVAADVRGSANVQLENADVNISIGTGGSGGPRGRHEGPSPSGNHAIPPSHMPPAGQCRIWHHGREPGQQPPPGDCKKLRKRVPQGASLVRG